MERLLQECCPGKLWQSELTKTDFLADWIVDVLKHVYRGPNELRAVLQKAIDTAWDYAVKQRS